MAEKLSVILADDHAIIRSSIRELLNHSSEFIVIGEAKNGIEAVRMVQSLAPDILLLDLEMPGMNGYEVITLLRQKGYKSCIVVLSAYDSQIMIEATLELGANGYLVKGEASVNIVHSLLNEIQGSQTIRT
jgi:DNA-binding NarL/FixJ family response regulator